jgi:hypothetical protein
MSRATQAAMLVPCLLALAGCSTPLWSPPREVEDTRIVAVSPRSALDRAGRWLSAHRFEIEKSYLHQRGGRVVAEQFPFEISNYARCAWMFRISGGVRPAARVTVIADAVPGGRTRVEARTEISLVSQDGDRAQCASHGRLEREILASIAGG